MFKKYIYVFSISLFMFSLSKAESYNLYMNLPTMGHSITKSPELQGNYVGSMTNANIIGFGIGYELEYDYRTEINLSYRNAYRYQSESFLAENFIQSDSQEDISALTSMLNIHKDFIKYKGFSTYLSSGLGLSRISLGEYKSYVQVSDLDPIVKTAEGKTNYNISWQLGGGTSIDVGDISKLDFSYRFTNVGNFSSTIHPVSNNKIKGNLSGHEFLIGLRTYF